ncbi:tRNA 2-thiouridine(34) synthase MnmA [Candidatus Bipolaricaulota bacterium]|nr:tRNA 2-thiouridine(34) synthase MnmA [Candidatus Bipolaricaulota bacterium]
MSGTEKRRADNFGGIDCRSNKKKSNKVLVAISGGVDSSVAALLLKQRGYDAETLTFWLWNYPNSPEYRGKENACCSLSTAEIVADQLDLPHHEVDLSSEFETEVVEHTIEQYVQGVTPNPCARCNRLVRFELLRNQAEKMGFSSIATGHYVRTAEQDGLKYLLKGVDENKDQSYFLYGLGQEELEKAIFPVGDYTKEEIYDIAEEEDLVTAEVEESQDLCFVPEGDYRDFLKREAGDRIDPGEIVDVEGNRLGEHEGLPFYTVGQRRGLGLENNQALYVVDLNYQNNRLVVGPEEELYSSGLIAVDCNWTTGSPPKKANLEVRIRYRATTVRSRVEATDDRVKVEFSEPQKSVSPGQIAAIYDGEKLLGGGVIDRKLS